MNSEKGNFSSSSSEQSSAWDDLAEMARPSKFRDEAVLSDEETVLVDAMQKERQNSAQNLRHERAQELTEREFNASLTSLDDLNEAILAGEPGISRRSIEYEGQKIPIYNLTGFPFRFIQHTVDYRLKNGEPFFDGFAPKETVKTSAALVSHPELWAKTEAEAMVGSEVLDHESSGRMRANQQKAGNTISMSYVDTERNLRGGGAKGDLGLSYAFLNLPADSILSVTTRDGGTLNNIGREKTRVETFVSPDDLADKSYRNYNEVQVRRYDEAGEPLSPSFIVTRGKITDYTKNHAKYFGVPIVNIEDNAYFTREKETALYNLSSVNEDTDYLTLRKILRQGDKAFQTAYCEPQDDYFNHPLNNLATAERAKAMLSAELVDALRPIMVNLEPKKRLEFLEEKLLDAYEDEVLDPEKTRPFFFSVGKRDGRNGDILNCLSVQYADGDLAFRTNFLEDDPNFPKIVDFVKNNVILKDGSVSEFYPGVLQEVFKN